MACTETMSTGTAGLHSSRLLPKIVHPASQLSKHDHDNITVEVRKLISSVGSRNRPHSCPKMSVDHLINSSRISSRLRHRTCSARQQRGLFSAGHRLSHCLTVDEVSQLQLQIAKIIAVNLYYNGYVAKLIDVVNLH